MVEFEDAAGGFSVRVNGRICGYIDQQGVFSLAQRLPQQPGERVNLSSADLRQIADKIDFTVAKAKNFWSVDEPTARAT